MLKTSVIINNNNDEQEVPAVTGFTKPGALSTIRMTMDKAVNDKCKSKLRVKNIKNLAILLRVLFTNNNSGNNGA